jgi:uncharacterized protein DUF4190
MKRCPTCNQTFGEEWLSFCTIDGTALVETGPLPSSEPPPTIRASGVPTNPIGQPANFNLPGSYQAPPAPGSYSPPAAPGWRPPPPPGYTATPQQGLAVAALILGIFTVTFGWCYVGVLTGPIAIILGIISLIQIKNNPERNGGRPMAIAGVVMGSVYFVLIAIFVIFAVLMQGVK